MIVGRFEIVATSGIKNGSVRVGKSDALADNVVDRHQRRIFQPKKLVWISTMRGSTAYAIKRLRKTFFCCTNEFP
jgi:hypothetical protein